MVFSFTFTRQYSHFQLDPVPAAASDPVLASASAVALALVLALVLASVLASAAVLAVA